MAEDPELKSMQATLSRHGLEHQRLSSEELKQRFPNIRLTKGEVGLLDKSGGVLYADKVLRALQVTLSSPRAIHLLARGIWNPILPDEGLPYILFSVLSEGLFVH